MPRVTEHDVLLKLEAAQRELIHIDSLRMNEVGMAADRAYGEIEDAISYLNELFPEEDDVQ